MKTLCQYIMFGFLVFISTLILLTLLFDEEDPASEAISKQGQVYDESEIPLVKPTLPDEVVVVLEEQEDIFEPVFTAEAISEEVYTRINGVSFKENPHIAIDDLTYLTISFINFDGQPQIGELIVHEEVSAEILEIFQILYEQEYPIERIQLVDDFEGDDEKSMAANNTSAFNYRLIAGTDKLSNHAYGLAIDINPMQNPYLFRNTIQPEGSETFLDRDVYQKGMILKEDICYTAFTERGWSWGGDWTSVKDYQHFEKKME